MKGIIIPIENNEEHPDDDEYGRLLDGNLSEPVFVLAVARKVFDALDMHGFYTGHIARDFAELATHRHYPLRVILDT
jgi:hypothetical protein